MSHHIITLQARADHAQVAGRGDPGGFRGGQDGRRQGRLHRLPLRRQVHATQQPGRGLLGGTLSLLWLGISSETE